LILEYKNESEILAILHRIMNSEEYQLNTKYLEKFSSRSKLAARILTIIMKSTVINGTIAIITFTAMAYFDSEMDFSIFIMFIWFVILTICWYYTHSVLMMSSLYIYLISLYMKYRLRQVQDLIEIYLKKGNTL